MFFQNRFFQNQMHTFIDPDSAIPIIRDAIRANNQLQNKSNEIISKLFSNAALLQTESK